MADLKTLGVTWSPHHTSELLDTYLEICGEMIKRGTAFVDDTPVEQMRDERMASIESKNRNNSVEKNMEMWNSMKKGTPRDSCVL